MRRFAALGHYFRRGAGRRFEGEDTMSSYHLNKLLRDVNQKPPLREAWFADREAFVAGYPLSDEERTAVLNMDIGALYRLGAHGLILRPFTLLHKMSEPDYLKAIREGTTV